MKRLFKIMLVCMLSVGIVGCSSTNDETLINDDELNKIKASFSDNEDVAKEINNIAKEIESKGVDLVFKETDKAKLFSGIYTYEDVNVQIFVTEEAKFNGVTLSTDSEDNKNLSSLASYVLSIQDISFSEDNVNELNKVDANSMIQPATINGFLVKYSGTYLSLEKLGNQTDPNKTPIKELKEIGYFYISNDEISRDEKSSDNVLLTYNFNLIKCEFTVSDGDTTLTYNWNDNYGSGGYCFYDFDKNEYDTTSDLLTKNDVVETAKTLKQIKLVFERELKQAKLSIDDLKI